jgi:hypothetical protein
MLEIPNNKKKKNRMEMLYFVCFWFCISFLFVLLYVSEHAPIKKYRLADSDCYMRLVRVSELYHSGGWYDTIISRSNAPYGESSHWSRPFDVLLMAGAVPLSLFTDFETALFWWGVIISPVLMIGAIVALQWSSRPILEEDGPFLAGFIFVFQMIIFTYFQPGRPDHHSLILLLFILSIGFALRMILRPFNAFLCYTAGAVGALAVWVSVESMLSILIIIAALGVLWILKDADFTKKGLHYSLLLFVFTFISMYLERPRHDLTTQQFDGVSIVHLGILGFIAAFWLINSILGRNRVLFQRTSHRFSFVLAGTAAVALMTLLCFPKFYKGPMANVDPRIIPIWLSKVNEVQPLFSRSDPLTIPLQLIISFVLSMFFLFYLILRKKRNENWVCWIFILFAAAVFFLISIYQVRWIAYAQILLIIPMTAFMVLLRQMGPKTGFLKTLKNVSIVMVFSLGLLLLSLLADEIITKGDSDKDRQKIPLIKMCKYLDEGAKWQRQSLRILTYVDFGAEILYRTRHEVIGTPYHRNSEGILDTYDIITADTDQRALEIIQKRGIDLILLYQKSNESRFYSKPAQTSTFYRRLREGKVPNWLRNVELPCDLSSSFLLFEIVE